MCGHSNGVAGWWRMTPRWSILSALLPSLLHPGQARAEGWSRVVMQGPRHASQRCGVRGTPPETAAGFAGAGRGHEPASVGRLCPCLFARWPGSPSRADTQSSISMSSGLSFLRGARWKSPRFCLLFSLQGPLWSRCLCPPSCQHTHSHRRAVSITKGPEPSQEPAVTMGQQGGWGLTLPVGLPGSSLLLWAGSVGSTQRGCGDEGPEPAGRGQGSGSMGLLLSTGA